MTEEHHKVERFTIREGDPLSATRARSSHSHSFERGGGSWKTRMDTWTKMTCSATEFILHGRLDAYEGEKRVLSRNWHVHRPPGHIFFSLSPLSLIRFLTFGPCLVPPRLIFGPLQD